MSFSVCVTGLGGAEFHIAVEPSESVADLRRKVEEIVGTSDLQEVKLFEGGAELCYHASIAGSALQPQSSVQAVVTKSIRKATETIKQLAGAGPHPMTPRHCNPYLVLHPFRGQISPQLLAQGPYLPDVSFVEKAVPALNLLADMGGDCVTAAASLQDVDGQGAVRYALEQVLIRATELVYDEACELLVKEIERDVVMATDLCELVSYHPVAAVRAAAMRGIGRKSTMDCMTGYLHYSRACAYGEKSIRGCENIALHDPDAAVRQAAEASLQGFHQH